MSLCDVTLTVIDNAYLIPNLNTVNKALTYVRNVQSLDSLLIILPLERDIIHLQNIKTKFATTVAVVESDNDVFLEKTVVIYLTPLDTLKSQGEFGTYVFSGFLTNNLLHCKTILINEQSMSCPMQIPDLYSDNYYVNIDGDDVLHDYRKLLAVNNNKFNLCFYERPVNTTRIILNIKRALYLLSSKNTKSTYTIKTLSDDIIDDVIKKISYERLRRLIKFSDSGNTCVDPILNFHARSLYKIKNTLHNDQNLSNVVLYMFNIYKKLIFTKYIIPTYIIVLNKAHAKNNCGIRFQKITSTYSVTSKGLFPPNACVVSKRDNLQNRSYASKLIEIHNLYSDKHKLFDHHLYYYW